MNDLVFPVNLCLLVQALAIQLLNILILLVQLRASVIDQASQLLNILSHVEKLVLCDLQVGL